MNRERKKNPAVVAIIVIVLLAAAGGAVYVATRPGDATTTQSTTQDTTGETSTPADTSDVASEYTDGTYEATGTYSTPGGRESVDLTVTITDGTITSTEIDGSATSGDSLQCQTRFINNYKTLVVGKKVDDVSLSRVAGSSLTSGGFNQALDQIKNEAGA